MDNNIISLAQHLLSENFIKSINNDENIQNVKALKMATEFVLDYSLLIKSPFFNGFYIVNDSNLEKYVRSFCDEHNIKLQDNKIDGRNEYFFYVKKTCVDINLATETFGDLEIPIIVINIWDKNCSQFELPGFFELHNVLELANDGIIVNERE